MTRPTGRPKGRPKTKEYETLMARVPQELADRAKRYARLHGQNISIVLRDGLELLLEEERYRLWVSDRKGDAENLSDRKGDENILSDTNEVGENLSDRNAVAEIVSDTKAGQTLDTAPVHVFMVSDTKADAIDPPQGPQTSAIVSDNNVPTFDTHKYSLGKLCPRGHAHGSSGQSLLRISNRHCLACDREKFHERKAQRMRQA